MQRTIGEILWKWDFVGRLGISVRAVERDDEKFLWVKGSEGKYQLTEAQAK